MALYASTVFSHRVIPTLHDTRIPAFSTLRSLGLSSYNWPASAVILLLGMVPVATNLVSPCIVVFSTVNGPMVHDVLTTDVFNQVSAIESPLEQRAYQWLLCCRDFNISKDGHRVSTTLQYIHCSP